jgi:hypothetical protein
MNPEAPPLADAAADAPAAAASPPRALYLAWAAFQRRQVSMAEPAGFDCVFLPLHYKGRSHLLRALHYLRLAWRTLTLLRARRPPVLWLQLPQLPLLWAALLHRRLYQPDLVLVADCHNAVFRPPWSTRPWGVSLLGRCEAVLVHNQAQRAPALAQGVPASRLCVLEDVPPLRPAAAPPPLPAAFAGRPRPWVLFAGSYGSDEPVAEVLQAARLLGTGVVALTGRLSNAAKNGHDIRQPCSPATCRWPTSRPCWNTATWCWPSRGTTASSSASATRRWASAGRCWCPTRRCCANSSAAPA